VSAGTTNYIYNALGQLVEKNSLGGTELQMYDEAGHLVSEYGIHGTLIEETIWMDDTPVAVIQPSGTTVAIYYVHTDHLNTPRKVTRPSDNGLMWRWDPDTFGSLQPNPNPAGLGAFTYNLRFAGQYFMNESQLFTNGFRTYDPITGRYLESDPIGLGGGINTYGYVGGNPISATDPTGQLAGLPVVFYELYLAYRDYRAAAAVVSMAVAATSSSPQAAKNCPQEEDCGDDSRLGAYMKALDWAGTSLVNDWNRLPWSQYRGRSGPNGAYIRGTGTAPDYGLYDTQDGSLASVENHPDGHPGQTGPDHHNCPHFHARNAAGKERIFIYRRGT
jgi:RHS repeat-associated protein